MSDFKSSLLETTDSRYTFICKLFDRALSNLSKMPRLWLMYLDFLIYNRSFTGSRRIVAKALQSLPITQHGRIWDIVINKFIGSEDFVVPVKTCKRLLYRYLQYEPEYADAVVSFLVDRGDIASAVELMVKRIETLDADASSSQLLLLIEMISKNSNKLKSLEHLDLPGIIRTGLLRYPAKLGDLWNSLADYYIRLGMFSKAIEVYEEALESVQTVVDFSVIFAAYQNFLELIVQTKLAQNSEDVEMDLQRLELLLDRRGEILSSVLLRQNPHNIIEWIKRARLPRISQDSNQVVYTLRLALDTVDPTHSKLVGRMSSLWTELAKHYLANSDLDGCRAVLEQAVNSPFKTVDELATVWTEWLLVELRLASASEASDDVKWKSLLEVARRSISQYRGSAKGTIQASLYRSVKLWHLAVDIETSIHGTTKPDLVRAMYNSMMDLRVITPQTVLNFAKFELDHLLFEKAIQVIEKGLALFPWPHCKDVWLFYLSLVVGHPRRFSTERVRDLFEQSLIGCPANLRSLFFFHYFKFEADRGLARNAIGILKRAAEFVPMEERAGFWFLAIRETTELLGSPAARQLFQAAIDNYAQFGAGGDIFIVEFCAEYCTMEVKLGQVERGRALLEHGSQYANPNRTDMAFFWDFWKNFEIQNGSEETYKQMKRVRRAVEVQYSDKHFNTLDVGMEHPSFDAEAVEVSQEPVKGIDVSKLRQMAQLHKKDVNMESGAFIPAESFQGTKEGYLFTNGASGLGYYKDAA